jgi:hypothetical protein
MLDPLGGGGQDLYFQACGPLTHSFADPAAVALPMADCTDASFDSNSAAYVSWGDPTGGSCQGQGEFTQQSIVPLGTSITCISLTQAVSC